MCATASPPTHLSRLPKAESRLGSYARRRSNLLTLERANRVVHISIDNVSAYRLIQCSSTTRGKSAQILERVLRIASDENQTLTENRRLSVLYTTILAFHNLLQRSSDQAQVLTCATPLTPLNMHAPLRSVRAWGDPSNQFSKGHLREITWQIWACPPFVGPSRTPISRV